MCQVLQKLYYYKGILQIIKTNFNTFSPRVKCHFRPRFGQFCDFRPKVCFSAFGSKRFEILPFSSGLLTPSIFLC
ncbi:hypothetical protein Hanom_Chr12g01157341 [Helianthus anomalus]